MRISWREFFLLLSVGLVGACIGQTRPAPDEGVEMSVQLSSSAFREGESIPSKHTCDGEDLSPPLQWSGIPDGARSLALIVDDPDAPVGTWVHWVLFDIPADVGGLPEGVQGIGVEGVNDFRRSGYGGPCPPRGSTHRYFFKLYVLDSTLNIPAGATKADIEAAFGNHILAQGQLIGRYGR